MQTTGACLFAFNRCSSPRVQMPAQDSRGAGCCTSLLYGTIGTNTNTVKVWLTSTLFLNHGSGRRFVVNVTNWQIRN
jgi:hypothetical protein